MPKEIYVSDLPSYFTKTVESSFYLRTIEERQTQENKKHYYDVQLVDSSGSIWGKIWEENMKPGHLSMAGKVVSIKGLITKNPTGDCQMVIRSMEDAAGFEMSDYIRGLTKEESSRYEEILWKYIHSIKHDGYHKLAEEIFSHISGLDSLPATLKSHHNFSGGFLVYTVSITYLAYYMLLSLNQYDRHPGCNFGYQPDLLITAALLHAVGTARMVTPFPDSRRTAASIPLGVYDLTLCQIQETAACHPEFVLNDTDLCLLLHVISCAYREGERKPMLREAVILKSAVDLQERISFFNHFLALNAGKEGMVYDETLGNYLYLKPCLQKEEKHD